MYFVNLMQNPIFQYFAFMLLKNCAYNMKHQIVIQSKYLNLYDAEKDVFFYSLGERDVTKKLFPGSNQNTINHQREMTVLKVAKPDHVNVPAATILKIPTSKSPLQQHLMSPIQGNSLLAKTSVPLRSEVMSSVQSVVTTAGSTDTRTPVTQLLARTLEKRQKQQQSAIVTGNMCTVCYLIKLKGLLNAN